MTLIAETDYYSIRIDRLMNRMFLAYKGSWTKPEQVPDFLKDHATAIGLLSPGFTVLVDVRGMESMVLTDFVEKAQMDAMEKGIRKAARVYDRPTFIQIQAESIHRKTGIKSKAFESMADAEAWLDEP
jgi:hypothetical protein